VKIKVAHLVNLLSAAGKEIGIVKLLNGLPQDQFESILIVFDRVYDALNLDVTRTQVIELKKKPGNDPLLPVKLIRLFRQLKVDIVHTHAWGTLLEGVLAARLAKVPVVIHGEHGSFYRDWKRRMVQKFVFKRTDYLLSVSDVLARDLSTTIGIPYERFFTILNGVDTEVFAPNPQKREQLRKTYGLSPQTIVLGTVGRPMKVKNQPLMIKALHVLKNRYKHLKLMLIGDTPRESMYHELVELTKSLQLTDDVIFAGHQSDVAGYLNAFDIFLLTSFSEGCSNVIQEAMAVGLPVVASRVGGNPELIRHGQTGLLFESDNVASLVQQVELLIEDVRKREELGLAARQDVLERFSLQKMIENYRNFYLNAVKNKRKSGLTDV